MKTSILSVPVTHLNGAQELDFVAVEEPLQIRIRLQRPDLQSPDRKGGADSSTLQNPDRKGGETQERDTQEGETQERDASDIAITMRTPGHDQELAAGFLFSEGILTNPDQIAVIKTDDRGAIVIQLKVDAHIEVGARNFYMTSSCGVCGKASIDSLNNALQHCGRPTLPPDQPRVSAAALFALPEKLRAGQAVFQHTGGLHAAGLFNTRGDLLTLREDVGRHNAVDKLIGAAFLEKRLPLHQNILLLSGRISFELVQKAVMAGIPIIAAVGAPSSLAVQTALRFGVTLVGFVREGRGNVYSGTARIN